MVKKKKEIKIFGQGGGGKGGGKGGGGKPNIQKPTGRSVASAYILGAICEGTIEGLGSNPLRNVFLDETPIENNDGSLNFKDFQFGYRTGTQTQAAITEIPGFDQVASPESVSAQVLQSIPNGVNKTIFIQPGETLLNLIIFKFSFQLQRINPDNGDTTGADLSFAISLKQDNNAFVTVLSTTIGGRFPSPTEFDYAIPVPANTLSSLTLRVQNFTVDNEETQQQGYQRQMQWIGYTKINSTTLRYPNTAIAAFGFNTSGFSSIPTAAFKVFGMLIRIPSNATVTAQRGLTYSGTWNGSFIYSTLAVSDPAWILYDLLTNTRYGLGDYIDIGQIDKWGLYEISQYCNGLVPDGYGGTEHRFQCNIALQSKTEAYQVLQSLITIFRGFSYWQSGAITFVADKPTNVSYQFTQADVEEGLFTYSRTGLKSKKTIALVSWLNPNDFYRKTVEVVEDPIGIQKWGIKELEVEAIACTSRGQARRAGVAILMGDRLEQETVIFKARAYAAFIKPGDVINILDSQRVEMRYGGLIKAATENTVTLDSPVTLISGESYKISVTLSNGTAVERTVVTGAGSDISTIVVSSNFPMIPLPESNWILSGTSVKPKKYRVINRVPVTETIEGMHEITAAEYDDSKYTFIDEMRMV